MSGGIFVSIAENMKHDPMMWPILGVSLLGVGVVVERFRYIQAAGSVKKDDFLGRVYISVFSIMSIVKLK